MENMVSITKTKGYSGIHSRIGTSINRLGRLEISGRVLIKINLCDLGAPSSGAITHPLFLDGLLGYLRKNYRDLDIVVIESDATAGRPDIIMSRDAMTGDYFIGPKKFHKEIIRNFIEPIENNRNLPIAGEEGRKTAQVIESALKSIKNREAVVI